MVVFVRNGPALSAMPAAAMEDDRGAPPAPSVKLSTG
jgi:hypothetical protein